MAIYWISFRIAKREVNNRSYQQRHDGLEAAIEDVSTNYWKETTSFIVFETESDFNALARAIKGEISLEHDLFLIRRMDQKSAYICGDNDDPSIFDLMQDNGRTYLRTL